ncbi:MAG: prepilin-type N-terminal cleavage/methylation domain-containing protein [Luteolibacter sp.]
MNIRPTAPFPAIATSRRDPASRGGFTLLELVLAMTLIALIAGMVFGTAKSSIQLGNTVVETQNEEMLHQAFFEFLGRRLSSLPGNTRLDLTSSDSGTHYLSDLTLQNAPMNFDWGGQTRTAKAVQLSTVKRRSGYLDIVLRYYENPLLEDTNEDGTTDGTLRTSALGNPPFAEITLLENVRFFEWRVLDGRNMDEWRSIWDTKGRLPLQMELNIAFGADGPELRHVFWLPPKADPSILMRQLMQSAGQNPNSLGGGNRDNDRDRDRPRGNRGDGEDGGNPPTGPGADGGGESPPPPPPP